MGQGLIPKPIRFWGFGARFHYHRCFYGLQPKWNWPVSTHPCNSQEASPVSAHSQQEDDSLVELGASQDELDALDYYASTEQLMKTSHEMSELKHQLHSKYRQAKKAAKQSKIQLLRIQTAETDHQLELLYKQGTTQQSENQGSSQPVATSTPQSVVVHDQHWL